MYELIAQTMNEQYGSSDMDPYLVENYLRYGEDDFLSADETVQIDVLYDKFL